MAKNKTFVLEQALTCEGWRHKVSLSVNAQGIITALGEGGKGEPIGGIVLPGLPNLHSHAFQRGFAGMTERAGDSADSFWTWREAMYHFVGKLTPEDHEAIATLAFIEMVESGFTSLAEFHYFHHDKDGEPYANRAEMAERIAAAALTAGIDLTLLPVFYAHSDFLGAAPNHGQRRFINDLDGFDALMEGTERALKKLPHARLGFAPHSVRAATLDEIKALLQLFPNGPVHIHISEQMKEVDDCIKAHGQRPVELLLNTIEVDARWCLIHATHANLAERNAMLKAKLVAGLCPITEANLGDGIFAAADFKTQGGAYGVGSDSNVEISAFEELKMLEYSQRLGLRRRNAMTPRNTSTGRSLFEGACKGGAQALGLAKHGFEVGARADFMVIDPNHISLCGKQSDTIVDSMIFANARSAIKDVYTAGQRMVEQGRHKARTLAEARFRAAIDRITA